MAFPLLIPALALGALAYLARRRDHGEARSPIAAITSGEVPSPLSVMASFLRRGEVPPPPVIMCAIAEAELLERIDVADAIVRAFVLPVVQAAERANVASARDANQFSAPGRAPASPYGYPPPQDDQNPYEDYAQPGVLDQPDYGVSPYTPYGLADAPPSHLALRAHGYHAPGHMFGRPATPYAYVQDHVRDHVRDRAHDRVQSQPNAHPYAHELPNAQAHPHAQALVAPSHPALGHPAPGHPALGYPVPGYPAPGYQAHGHPAPSPDVVVIPPMTAPRSLPIDDRAEPKRSGSGARHHEANKAAEASPGSGPPHLGPHAGTVTVSGKSSPIQGVDTADWASFVGRVSRELPTYMAAHHVGQFRQRKDRLVELGIEPAQLAGSHEAQLQALEADMSDAYQHAHASGLLAEHVGALVDVPVAGTGETHQITCSGVMGVIQAAGLEGAAGWLEDIRDRKRFPNTTQAFLRTNGTF
jgi:hypothetical protein